MNPALQQLAEKYATKHPAPNYALTNDELHLYIVNGFTSGYNAHAASVKEVLREAREAIQGALKYCPATVQINPAFKSILEKLKQFEQ